MKPKFLTPKVLAYAKEQYNMSKDDILALEKEENEDRRQEILTELFDLETEMVLALGEGEEESELLVTISDFVTAITYDPPYEKDND